jgi:hypothetical protein
MLGSLNEADDAVQEAWFRLSQRDAGDVENLVPLENRNSAVTCGSSEYQAAHIFVDQAANDGFRRIRPRSRSATVV